LIIAKTNEFMLLIYELNLM